MPLSSCRRNDFCAFSTLAISEPASSWSPKIRAFAPYAFRDGNTLKHINIGDNNYPYIYLDWYQVPKELERAVWSEPYFDEGAGNIMAQDLLRALRTGPVTCGAAPPPCPRANRLATPPALRALTQ